MPKGLPDSWATWAVGRASHSMHSRGRRGGSGRAIRTATQVQFAYRFKGLKLYEPEFKIMINGDDGLVGRYMKRKARAITAAAKAQVGYKTGALKKSIHFRHTTHAYGHKLWIGSRLSYAYMHHEGTKPHVILPKKAEVLRFSKGTRVIYSRAVYHPGTRPNRYLSNQLAIALI